MDRTGKWLGGSDIAAILGVHSMGKTPADVYDEHMGLVPQEELDAIAEDPNIRRGNAFEPMAAQEYALKTRRILQDMPELVISPEGNDWLRCHVDRWWVGVDTAGLGPTDALVLQTDFEMLSASSSGAVAGVPVELKCPNVFAFYRLLKGGMREENIIQLQAYIWASGRPLGSFGVFCADQMDTRSFDVGRNDELIALIEQAGAEFIETYLIPEVRPAPGAATPVNLPIEIEPLDDSVRIVESDEWHDRNAQLWEAWQIKKQAAKLYDDRKEAYGGAMLAEGFEACEGDLVGIDGKRLRVFYRETQGRKTLQEKPLRGSRPIDRLKLASLLADESVETIAQELDGGGLDLDFDQFVKQGDPFRSLKPFEVKG